MGGIHHEHEHDNSHSGRAFRWSIALNSGLKALIGDALPLRPCCSSSDLLQS